MAGRPINTSKELAILSGDKTYTGAAHGKCGTTERYVSGGGCVHCARQASLDGREARRLLKAQKAGEVPGVHPTIAPGEMSPYEGFEEPDPFTKAVDDLM